MRIGHSGNYANCTAAVVAVGNEVELKFLGFRDVDSEQEHVTGRSKIIVFFSRIQVF